jgi:predicted nucleic-acid-binding protein
VKLVGIDTNILLRLIVDDDERQRAAVLRFGEKLNKEFRGLITLVSLLETDWALRRQYGYSRRESIGAIRRLTGIRGVDVERHDVVTRAMHLVDLKNVDFADALLAGCASEEGCERVFTFDKGAAEAIPSMELLS